MLEGAVLSPFKASVEAYLYGTGKDVRDDLEHELRSLE
jgi:hypothetical protein